MLVNAESKILISSADLSFIVESVNHPLFMAYMAHSSPVLYGSSVLLYLMWNYTQMYLTKMVRIAGHVFGEWLLKLETSFNKGSG